jgi:hypothetical protein
MVNKRHGSPFVCRQNAAKFASFINKSVLIRLDKFSVIWVAESINEIDVARDLEESNSIKMEQVIRGLRIGGREMWQGLIFRK